MKKSLVVALFLLLSSGLNATWWSSAKACPTGSVRLVHPEDEANIEETKKKLVETLRAEVRAAQRAQLAELEAKVACLKNELQAPLSQSEIEAQRRQDKIRYIATGAGLVLSALVSRKAYRGLIRFLGGPCF